jgi:hypothetical protein
MNVNTAPVRRSWTIVHTPFRFLFVLLSLAGSTGWTWAQAPELRPPGFDGPPPFDGPAFGPGPRGPGGPGGPGGGPPQPELKVRKQFDKNGDGVLDATERGLAREFVKSERAQGRGGRGPGGRRGPFGRAENQEPPKPGPKISPAAVKSFPDAGLYEPAVLRTFFIEFAESDWEKELADFANTDVDIPAKVTVDGRTYEAVGVHFRGASSYFTVGEGFKHSLNLSFDLQKDEQNLHGYRTINLLNSHEDPSFLRTVLYLQIAREYIPAPKANYAQVVINGESWGVYVNAQQFNKDFVRDFFGTTKGARWKVPGSPRGRGGLTYLGEGLADYRSIYEIKSKNEPKAWSDLIRLCRVLEETPTNQLIAALSPLLDVDGTLKFLALENALINNDGYWVRTSDYNLYQDEKGRFHLMPHDVNETFSLPGGPGFGRRGPGPGGPGGPGRPGGPGGPGGPPGADGIARNRVDGVKLDPLTGASDSTKPLLSKLLAVPALRAKYLGYVRDIATRWLDWQTLGPIATRYHALIRPAVAADTRKLDSLEAFDNSLLAGGESATNANHVRDAGGAGGFRPGPRVAISLKTFADQRRSYLLNATKP